MVIHCISLLCNSKLVHGDAISKVILASMNLRARSSVWNLWENAGKSPALYPGRSKLVHWDAKNSVSSSSNFSVEWNNFTSIFQKQQKVA